MEELEAQRPPEVDARIAALTADRDSWERQCRNAERGLAEAKAEIEALRAELLTQVKGLMADAEIGRLVRGMRPYTSFVRGHGCCWAEEQQLGVWRRIGRGWFPGPDAIVALRAIQKEVDE